VESFYKDGNALYSLTVEKGAESAACSAIRTLIGPAVAIAGEAANYDAMQSAAGREVLHAVAILVPAIILLLILSTSSWVEPLLFLAAVGMSVLINMGTNIFFGEVSFVTNAVGPILQLAVSLDYAVFLLHSFNDYRQSCATAAEAMRKAMRASVTTVAASASTTLFGFLALVFMDFKSARIWASAWPRASSSVSSVSWSSCPR
jgi:predicted RND superfamily exporter protein